MSHPWSLAFLPDGRMLITERSGRLRMIRDGVLDPQPMPGVPKVHAVKNAGLFDVALHPKFAGCLPNRHMDLVASSDLTRTHVHLADEEGSTLRDPRSVHGGRSRKGSCALATTSRTSDELWSDGEIGVAST